MFARHDAHPGDAADSLRRRPKAHNTLIDGWCSKGEVVRAWAHLRAMPGRGYQPNGRSFVPFVKLERARAQSRSRDQAQAKGEAAAGTQALAPAWEADTYELGKADGDALEAALARMRSDGFVVVERADSAEKNGPFSVLPARGRQHRGHPQKRGRVRGERVERQDRAVGNKAP